MEKVIVENKPTKISSETHEEDLQDIQNPIDLLSLRPQTKQQDKGKSVLIIPQEDDTEVGRQ